MDILNKDLKDNKSILLICGDGRAAHALDSKEGEPAERDRGVQLPFPAS